MAGRPTLGEILQKNLVQGELAADEVRVQLRPLAEGDRVVLEDPPSLTWLAGLPGCPGPWRIRFEAPAAPEPDPVGDQLRDLFSAREELP